MIDNIVISTAGARGLVEKEFNTSFVYNFVSAYVYAKKLKKVVISRDNRPSYKFLYQALIKSLQNHNVEIINLDLCPLPTTALGVKYFSADAGIMLTASHNPVEYNGLKFLDEEGEFISSEVLDLILSCFNNQESVAVDDFYKIPETNPNQSEIFDFHIDLVKNLVPTFNKRLTIAVDAVNSAGSVIIPKLLEKLGHKVIELACDPNLPFPRLPEPNIETLQWTSQEFKKNMPADLCVVVDPDADRLTLLDENGDILSEEFTLPMIGLYLKQHYNEGVFVVNLSTSNLITEVLKDTNWQVKRSEVGEARVVKKMKETNAFFGGEGNGGVIDPKAHYNRDSLVGIVYILALLSFANKTISEIVNDFPVFTIEKKKFSLSNQNKKLEELIKEILQQFKSQEWITDNTDGYWFSNPKENWWIHIRESKTEPIVRLIYEYKDSANTTLQNIINLCIKFLE